MQGFDDIELTWLGQTYTVPANRQMELILRVEQGLIEGTGAQAYEILMRPSGPPLGQFSRVFAEALRYAGAPVQHIEVFREITGNVGRGDGALLQDAVMQVMRILNLIAIEEDEAPQPKRGKAAKK